MDPMIFFVFTAGLFSVASPCVLPVLPILLTGTSEDHALRPLLIIFGLSLSFIITGLLLSLSVSFLAGNTMQYVEKGVGVLILIFGALMAAGINLFKGVSIFSNIQYNPKGLFSGLFIGLSLGIIWIPCVGTYLSAVYAGISSAKYSVGYGAFLLFIYSLGFAIPMLIVAYSSHSLRKTVMKLNNYPKSIAIVSGGILILFGIYIIAGGLVGGMDVVIANIKELFS